MFQRFGFGSVFSLTFAVFAAFAGFGLLAPQATAGEKHSSDSREGKHLERFIKKLEKELELTPAQSVQVREILRPDSMAPAPERGRSRTPLFGGEFLDQLRPENVDTAALNRAFAERQALMAERHERRLAKFVQLHAVLSPAQRAKLADRLADHSEKARKERRKK